MSNQTPSAFPVATLERMLTVFCNTPSTSNRNWWGEHRHAGILFSSQCRARSEWPWNHPNSASSRIRPDLKSISSDKPLRVVYKTKGLSLCISDQTLGQNIIVYSKNIHRLFARLSYVIGVVQPITVWIRFPAIPKRPWPRGRGPALSTCSMVPVTVGLPTEYHGGGCTRAGPDAGTKKNRSGTRVVPPGMSIPIL
jgi:hypothetical protein